MKKCNFDDFEDDHHLNLGQLIDILRSLSDDLVLCPGFVNPHSYRGYYERIAFEPVSSTTVGESLRLASRSVNQTFSGYKGGEFTMGYKTLCHITPRGTCNEDNDALTVGMLRKMITRKASKPQAEAVQDPSKKMSEGVRDIIITSLNFRMDNMCDDIRIENLTRKSENSTYHKKLLEEVLKEKKILEEAIKFVEEMK